MAPHPSPLYASSPEAWNDGYTKGRQSGIAQAQRHAAEVFSEHTGLECCDNRTLEHVYDALYPRPNTDDPDGRMSVSVAAPISSQDTGASSPVNSDQKAGVDDASQGPGADTRGPWDDHEHEFPPDGNSMRCYLCPPSFPAGTPVGPALRQLLDAPHEFVPDEHRSIICAAPMCGLSHTNAIHRVPPLTRADVLTAKDVRNEIARLAELAGDVRESGAAAAYSNLVRWLDASPEQFKLLDAAYPSDSGQTFRWKGPAAPPKYIIGDSLDGKPKGLLPWSALLRQDAEVP